MGHRSIPPRLRTDARRLRKEMTTAEERLWQELRARRLHEASFRRQVPIAGYVVDFVCHEARLVVEVDGDVHDLPGAAERDERRTARLEREGYRVVRVDNAEVTGNLEGVLVEIGRHLPRFETDLAVETPLPVPPPQGGRGRQRMRSRHATGAEPAPATRPDERNSSPIVPSPPVGEGQGEG